MIPPELAQYFPHAVRARGEQYVASDRVTLMPEEPLLVRAIAQGGSPWLVTLDARGGTLSLGCACPFAIDRGFCKHIWAALRLADGEGLLATLLKASNGLFVDSSIADGDAEIEPDWPPVPKLALEQRTDVPATQSRMAAQRPDLPEWRQVVERVTREARYEHQPKREGQWPADRRLIYLVDLPATMASEGLVLELATEKRDRDGRWGVPKLYRSGMSTWMAVPDPIDREIGQMLRGTRRSTDWTESESATSFVLSPATFDPLLKLMSESGRLRVRRDPKERPTAPARFDAGVPWRLRYAVERTGDDGMVIMQGTLHRDAETLPLGAPDVVHSAGFLVQGNTIARCELDGPFALVRELRARNVVSFHEAELPAVVGALAQLPRTPPIQLATGLNVTEVSPSPVPVLTLTAWAESWRRDQFSLALAFDYDGLSVSETRPGAAVFDARNNRIVRRNLEVEAAAHQRLQSMGARREHDWRFGGDVLVLPVGRFQALLRPLTAEGWIVLVNGVRHRPITDLRATVRSGVDWFDVECEVVAGDVELPLPLVLEALRGKQSTITLDDGSVGLIDAELRARLAPVVAMTALSQKLRFRASQAALLDALLATLPDVDADARFEQARVELRAFERVQPAHEPRTFQGELRPYQRDALGWFHFLRRFGLGGCLADDMGLGKTVQVLALFEARRLEGAGPSLVVVPRSLIFNWRQEAGRFTPALRVLDHTGTGRSRSSIELGDANLVLTTYGTLRRDITALREIEFDYVVLDEAQAIKNATTAAAKAARLLRGANRLALSGTPIENRVEELWSLFEFLNPGMLGTSSAFRSLARARSAPRVPSSAPAAGADTAVLARALRPVVLRRTKELVAPELPPRVEQTLLVELEPPQRKVYDELLAHYRGSLLPYVARMGMERSRMKVLEALLRLRQAACHPALISRTADDAPSAKLDVLVPKLAEAAAEQHKSLVFSQFTSFLALLRERLDADRVRYAYLDGDTRDRQSVVEQFQQDPECRLFLISLRAGGQGLNLTAADYVFLLDPWWNPAVEAQAIDRAHRIGQHRHVIATRLVARDTIEEKILELQRTKRDLADAILSEDQGTLAKIGREELELLLA